MHASLKRISQCHDPSLFLFSIIMTLSDIAVSCIRTCPGLSVYVNLLQMTSQTFKVANTKVKPFRNYTQFSNSLWFLFVFFALFLRSIYKLNVQRKGIANVDVQLYNKQPWSRFWPFTWSVGFEGVFGSGTSERHQVQSICREVLITWNSWCLDMKGRTL